MVRKERMNCRELATLMDSYMGDELLVETNHEVLAHLESCADCRIAIAERRELASQLKRTMRSQDEAQISTVFATKLRRELMESALQPSLWQRTVATMFRPAVVASFAAITLLVAASAVWFGSFGRLPLGGNISVAEAIRVSFTELAAIAAGDHENCAVKFNLKEIPITLDEAAAKFGSYNKDLDKTVISAISTTDANNALAGSEFVESHSCIYDGRRFAHVVVKKNGEMVSMLVTDTDLPLTNGEIIAATGTSASRAAGFVVGHHAVFIVSKLSESENVALAGSFAPAIRSHFEKLGA
jgi:hypothetical protein